MQFYNKYRNGIYTLSNYCMPVIAKYGTGGGNTPLVLQDVTGTLSPGGHPGSYNGQDAYNDMLIVNDGSNSDKSSRLPYEGGLESSSGIDRNGSQRPTDYNNFEGGY